MGKRERLKRTEMLIGDKGIENLAGAHVAVFGLGGVGGSVVEGLARSGVGKLTLIDGDIVDESNLNRQIIATYETLGESKVDVAKARVHSLAPECKVDIYKQFVLPGEFGEIGDFKRFDFVVDAIDTVGGKLAIIKAAKESEVPVISSMGTGNKLNPKMLEIDDISRTKVCPLARVMRKKLKEMGLSGIAALYSTEVPIKTGSPTPGSMSYVPPIAGLMISGYVIRNLLKN